ncbi:homocysteine S-methyltransferase [Kribbella orskensis]|uniref:Homocysteine S-methyltransferase n=1 Tax=Kribbella orskensis TaxID=2512216 RepID=A0ABY2BHH8_9ACTN|nr:MULTISPECIES: homocysteine S-methyltransferase [Kribbella]TCN38260.1 homocysteine S-methyltransferase [Kribbella sp. VKM Ac-2500]TCO20210.1 homocysteine S-methyltransferase [Kribbella orskensis]
MQTVVLDGGMSNALEDRGHDLSDALWSARLLRDAPGEIAAVHRSYYDAGAAVATTASYQASVSGFERAGVPRDEAERLIGSSVTLAREVRDSLADDGVRRLVAASVGPYGAVLADGSEYRGRYGVSRAFLREFHLARLELLVAAGPDLLAVETIPDVDEAEVLVELLNELAFPAWFSYSIEGDRTRAGQPLEDAFAVAGRSTAVVAVGINCCAPGDVQAAVETAVAVTGKPAVAYPNSGEEWDAGGRRWTGGATSSATLAHGWAAAGATYVGGCCRVGPGDISALARALDTQDLA